MASPGGNLFGLFGLSVATWLLLSPPHFSASSSHLPSAVFHCMETSCLPLPGGSGGPLLFCKYGDPLYFNRLPARQCHLTSWDGSIILAIYNLSLFACVFGVDSLKQT